MTVGSFMTFQEEETAALVARDYKDPPLICEQVMNKPGGYKVRLRFRETASIVRTTPVAMEPGLIRRALCTR